MGNKQRMEIKILSPMEKVFPDRQPSGDGAPDHLTALKGETVSFQIAYTWDGWIREYGRASLTVIPPEGTNGAAVTARVRTAELSPCKYPCHPQKRRDAGYLTTAPGLYPDLLRETGSPGFSLICGQWRSLWVDLEVPETADAGNYTVCYSVEPADVVKEPAQHQTEQRTGSLTLTVLSAKLPALDIPHTEWFHSDCLANYYGVEVFSERHWEIIRNFVAAAAARGCNTLLTPLFTPPLDTAIGKERLTVQLVDVKRRPDGGWEFGFEKFRRWVRMAQECGIRYFEMNHLFSQWGAVFAPKVVAETENGSTEIVFGWDTKATSPEYSSFLHVFLDALIPQIDLLGIRDLCFFHISDEPAPEQLDTYTAAKSIVAEQLKGFRIIDALSNYEFYQSGAVQEPICGLDHLDPFLENRPEKLWTYYCTAQSVDVSNRFIVLPGFRTRILGAQLYKYQLDGFLQWGYNFYNSVYSLYSVDPYQTTDSDGAFPSGDPFLVYPGKDGMPEESIRLMLMDEAFSDYRAMKLLESLTDRETVLACLEEETFGELGIKSYPQSAAYVQKVRDNVNRKIAFIMEHKEQSSGF